jgi:hypothetical protein
MKKWPYILLAALEAALFLLAVYFEPTCCTPKPPTFPPTRRLGG